MKFQDFQELFEKENDITLERFMRNYGSISITHEQREKIGETKFEKDERSTGSGDYDGWERVIYFEKYKVFISIDGYYDSNNGVDFDYGEINLVTPKEVTYTDIEYHIVENTESCEILKK